MQYFFYYTSTNTSTLSGKVEEGKKWAFQVTRTLLQLHRPYFYITNKVQLQLEEAAPHKAPWREGRGGGGGEEAGRVRAYQEEMSLLVLIHEKKFWNQIILFKF